MWFKVDDQFHEHPKLRAIEYDLPALGLWVLAGSWCGDNSRDGFIPSSVLRRWMSPAAGRRHAATLVRAGLWEEAEVGPEVGWRFHDWGERNPTDEETATDIGKMRWRRKNALSKDKQLREQIITRDHNCCRYCAVPVNWSDRVGTTGGTYDHVDPNCFAPNLGNFLDGIVVACRRCNGVKRDRTPTEAGMPLLPVPDSGVSSGADSDLALPTRDGAESGRSRVGTVPGVRSGAGSGVESVRVPAHASNGSNGNGHGPSPAPQGGNPA